MRKLAFSERQIAFILVRESNVGRELSTATLLMQPALRTPDRRRAAVRCSALAAPGNGSDSTADPLRGGRTYGSIVTSHSQRRGAVLCIARRAGQRTSSNSACRSAARRQSRK